LRSLRRRRGRAAQFRWLGQGMASEEAKACNSDTCGACRYGHSGFPFGVWAKQAW
jgi:hypothetical protein